MAEILDDPVNTLFLPLGNILSNPCKLYNERILSVLCPSCSKYQVVWYKSRIGTQHMLVEI